MKKILIVLLSILFLAPLAACADKHKTNENTSIALVNSTALLNENTASHILFLTLADISDIETAYSNMEAEDFEKFISEHPKHYEANGINSREDAKRILDELKETTVILLDGDVENVSEMYFYLDRNEIQQPVVVENDKKIICTYYTPQKQSLNALLSNNQNAELITEMAVAGVPMKIYRIQSNDAYFAELTVNETAMFFRVINMESVDELKASFNRLSFVKIGDLLKA